MRLKTHFVVALSWAILAASVYAVRAAEPVKPLRVGIIGLDTGHAVEFTKLLNDPKAGDELSGVVVVAAYPGGSPDIQFSRDTLKGNTDQLLARGVRIVDSIDELLKEVDVVLLESVDGRPHLAQARPVIAAGKPLFVDKPMAASLADAMQIFRLAKANNVPCFSASSLRFIAGLQDIRNGESSFGKVKSCVASSPMSIEPHHPDLFWYGIHGVETLFTSWDQAVDQSPVSRLTKLSAFGRTAAKERSWRRTTWVQRSRAIRPAAISASMRGTCRWSSKS